MSMERSLNNMLVLRGVEYSGSVTIVTSGVSVVTRQLVGQPDNLA